MNNTIKINSKPADIMEMLYQQQIDQAERVYYEMAKHFWSIIGTANQVAYMSILEAVDMMRDAGMLRQQQKVKALKTLEEFDRYQHGAYMVFQADGDDRYPLWQDLTLRAAHKLQPDVQRLFFAIKNVIDKACVSNSQVHAQVQTGVALVTLATLLFDTMAGVFQKQTVMDIHKQFGGGRLTAVERLWLSAAEIMGRQVMKDVNLKDDEQCQLGVRVILTKYQQADFLNEAAGEALRLNPQVMHHLTEHEKEDITK